MQARWTLTLLLAVLAPAVVSRCPAATAPTNAADRALADYFRAETARIEERCLADVKTAADWERLRPVYRQQLFEMLGLQPLPPRGELQAVVTGRRERDEFTVENVHFQSLPGFYVTANLYLPRNAARPVPAVLYLSGHGPVISNGVSYGNKVSYQHHGAWFARHGYACLVLDSVQLGEILGLHHGTYREGLWWWNSRGYTPAGAEAWNCLRALDYLATRPEVDASRIGATGRSGGGAYSWWIAALDERIRAAAPVAGITDLRNHVVDGTVEGHCDCMFTVNTYRWDYPHLAALVAPRPLLIVNTDTDTIFPLDGVVRTFEQVRRIYQLGGVPKKLGLVIGPGGHDDTQDVQVPVLRWFNRHLKGEDPLVEKAAVKLFAPAELKVFDRLPANSRNTNIHETFVAAALTPEAPRSTPQWQVLRDGWIAALRTNVFGGWPETAGPPALLRRCAATRDGLSFEVHDFESQPGVTLRLYVLKPVGEARLHELKLQLLSEEEWSSWLAGVRFGFADQLGEELALAGAPAADEAGFRALAQRAGQGRALHAFFAPRGIGLSAWSGGPRKHIQIRRRFMLLGQTLDGMRVWDVRQACLAVRALATDSKAKIELLARGTMAANALHASLWTPEVGSLALSSLPRSHQRGGPDYLNVLRWLDLPAVVALAAERHPVTLFEASAEDWQFPQAVARNLGWDSRQLRMELADPTPSQ